MAIPRWKIISDAVRADIQRGKLPPGSMLPSETELAAHWRVSRVTANRAMTELQREGLVTRKRRVGTKVVAPGAPRTSRIAVFLNTQDFLEQEFVAGIRGGLPDEYDLLICDVRLDPHRESYFLRRMQSASDGIICIPTCNPRNQDQFRRSVEAGRPLVFLDCIPEDLTADAIISDNYGATLDALRFLVARGHSQIAHFTVGEMTISSLRERYAAYETVLSELGVKDKRRWLREFPYALTRDPVRPVQAVEDAVVAFTHMPDRPTAIFCAHDYVLSAVIQACRRLEVPVPGTFELASFNDCPPFVPYLPGHIHRIVQRSYEMGKLAAERLCNRMGGDTSPPEVIRVAPSFYPASGQAGSHTAVVEAPADGAVTQ